MIIGNSIIEYLEEETKKNDPAESSHWKKFNYDFKFDGKNFTGLKGFGELGIRFFGISNLIHNVFQKPWKKIGKEKKERIRVINVRTQNFQEFCRKIHFITILLGKIV